MTVRMQKTPTAEATRDAIREQAKAEREMLLQLGRRGVPTQDALERELARVAERQDNQRK